MFYYLFYWNISKNSASLYYLSSLMIHVIVNIHIEGNAGFEGDFMVTLSINTTASAVTINNTCCNNF